MKFNFWQAKPTTSEKPSVEQREKEAVDLCKRLYYALAVQKKLSPPKTTPPDIYISREGYYSQFIVVTLVSTNQVVLYCNGLTDEVQEYHHGKWVEKINAWIESIHLQAEQEHRNRFADL